MSKRNAEREGRWRGLVAEWERSGQAARVFCQDRKLNVHTLYGWRRELRRRDGLSKSAVRRRRRERFVQLQVSGPSWLEVAAGDGLTLRVPASIDTVRLTEILSAVRQATGRC